MDYNSILKNILEDKYRSKIPCCEFEVISEYSIIDSSKDISWNIDKVKEYNKNILLSNNEWFKEICFRFDLLRNDIKFYLVRDILLFTKENSIKFSYVEVNDMADKLFCAAVGKVFNCHEIVDELYKNNYSFVFLNQSIKDYTIFDFRNVLCFCSLNLRDIKENLLRRKNNDP